MELQIRGGYCYTDNPQYSAGNSLFEKYRITQADVVFIGDSIIARCDWSEMYPYIVTANRGIGSDTTEGVLYRLDSVIELNPDVVVIMVGTNDISLGCENSLSNMEEICNNIKNNLPKTTVVILPILPSTEGNRTLEKIELLNEGYKDLCKRNGYIFLDIYEQYIDNKGHIMVELYSEDGIHLNGDGYEIIVEELDLLFKMEKITD